ncbi:DUF2920 family protein [Parvibaculaceae bacterium PLY_AMNH_Bact1]|nr:DUF2920 family protein [Parvibaculaceae bacterium PLY_AMNH_Bact1]
MTSHRFEIDGQPDFELGAPRQRPVTAIVEVPESDAAEGLVFIVPGMGSERDEGYYTMLRRYIAAKYNLVAVSVDAHCNVCRPHRSDGVAPVVLDVQSDSIYEAFGRFISAGGKVDRPLTNINDMLALLLPAKSNPVELNTIIQPPDGDYQNFGVLAALDHLAVLNVLLDSDIAFDQTNIVCMGSSHGGYLAHMIHKFAPNTINGVIDASAYTEAIPIYLDGQFREISITESHLNLTHHCSTKSLWQFKTPTEPYFFDTDRALIRDVGHCEHLGHISETSERKCQFRMIHSRFDNISPPAAKVQQAEVLNALGYNVQLDIVEERDVDGKFIKSLDHGMGIALELLFDKYYPTLEKRNGRTDRDLGSVLHFHGPKYTYRLRHQAGSLHADVKCEGRQFDKPAVERLAG